MAKLSIKLDTRSVKAGGTSPLKLAVGQKGQTAYIPLGRNVRPDQWDEGSGTVIRHPRRNEINLEIIAALDRAERTMAELDTRAMTAAQIRDILARPEARSLVLTSWETKMAGCSTPGNREVYRQSLSALRAADPQFDTRSFGDISKSYLEEIDRKMATARSLNSRSIAFRCLRAVFNAALDEGLTTLYPFRQFSPKTEQTRKRSLTVEQLRALIEHPRADMARPYLLGRPPAHHRALGYAQKTGGLALVVAGGGEHGRSLVCHDAGNRVSGLYLSPVTLAKPAAIPFLYG